MVPSPSRRRVLAGAVGLGAAGLAGASRHVHIGPVESWRPAPGTWPHERYGPRNTATNAGASPPADPTVAWRVDPIERVDALVVGPDSVYVGGDWNERGVAGVAALDRGDGTVRWTADVPGYALALRGETLYAGTKWGEPRGVTALDAASGERRWQTPLGPPVVGLLVAGGTVFAAQYDGLAALDAGSGRVRWSGLLDNAFPAVADGALFVAGGHVRRSRSRRASDVLTGRPPPTAWEADDEKYGWPVVDDGRVVVGSQFWIGSDDPGLYAFDAETGERRWRTVDPLSGPAPVVAGPPAVADGRGFFKLRHGREAARTHALVACSLADGAVRWRRDLGDWITGVVVAGGTVLAGTAADRAPPGPSRTELRAFTPAGGERWRFETPEAVHGLAAAGDTVFLGTGFTNGGAVSGAVLALR